MKKLKKIFRVLVTLASLVLTLFLANVDIKAQTSYPDVTLNFHDKNPLFYEEDIYPGDTFVRKVSVQYNAGEENIDIFVGAKEIQTVGELSDVLSIYVSGGLYDFSSSLTNLYNLKRYKVDTLQPGQSRDYEVKITFEKESGNQYMNKLTSFDYSIITFSTNDGEILGVEDEANTQLSEEPGGVLGVTGQFLIIGIVVGAVLLLSFVATAVISRMSREDDR